ncbi:MAG: cytochrome c [Acidobacteriota bacterium]|jgi:mono/diheme cytochrome c family protein
MIEKYVDAEELKRMISTLVAIVGCLIIAALFGILVVPGLRNANKPAAPTAVSPVTGETGWLDPTEFPVQKGRLIPPVDPATLMKPSEELTGVGEKLYQADCATCHGTLGRGDGPASNVSPGPRDFKAAESDWTNGPDIPDIYKTLNEGVPGTSMASFDYLTKRERMALVHYIQVLGGYPGKAGSAVAMQALSKELAAPGEKTNNKIPVSMAMAKLESEFVISDPLIIPADDDSPGTVILRRTIMDGSRAAQVLRASRLWRTGPEALARSVIPDAPGNGFSTTVATLKPVEWEKLYQELVKRIGVS